MSPTTPQPAEPLRVVGVIDIRGGVAVHAQAGDRARYVPVAQAAGLPIDGDAVSLARAYVDARGVRELYVADLDAIEGGVAAMHRSLLREIAAVGVPVWVDAGVSNADDARAVLEAGASTLIVGLETLSGFDALATICAGVGESRVAFSLDLRGGVPMIAPNASYGSTSPVEIACRAAETGVRRMIVIDVARVGVRGGVDQDLIAAIRAAVPEVALFPGGGVRDQSDLTRLEALGCRGALVATGLLNGVVRG